MPIDLEDAANNLGFVAPDLKTGTGKVLEAQVLFALALRLKQDFAVQPLDPQGHPLAGSFELRGGPGHLADPASATGPSYFGIGIDPHFFFELHNSLEFKGAGGEHEVDISLVDASAAHVARYASPRMMQGPPLLGIELKEYSKEVDKNLVRAFFACIVDFLQMWPIQQFSIGPGPDSMQNFTFPARPTGQFWFLTTGSLSQPTRDFASAYAIQAVDGLDSAKLGYAVTAMAARVKNFFPAGTFAPAAGVRV